MSEIRFQLHLEQNSISERASKVRGLPVAGQYWTRSKVTLCPHEVHEVWPWAGFAQMLYPITALIEAG